mgnify:CR=1 FL=1
MKYWAYINNEIKGPFEKEELIKIEGFNKDTLLCPQSPVEEETKEWKEAFQFPEIFEILELKKEDDKKTNEPAKHDFNEVPQPSVLETNNKNDIIIERFNTDTVFNLNTDISETAGSSFMDPLSLSQISRKTKDIINSEAGLNSEIKQKVEEYRGEVKEFKEKPEEFALNKDDFESLGNLETEFRREDNNKEEKNITEEVKSNTNLNLQSPFDKETIKKEIIDEIEKKLSSFVSRDNFEFLKNEMKNYIDSKFEIINNSKGDALKPLGSENENILKHLEIDVKDMRVRLEALEKKSDFYFRSQNTEKIDDKTVIIQKEKEEKNENKNDKTLKKSPLKIILSLFLSIIAVGSIAYMLNQFGIIDIDKFFNNNKTSPLELNNSNSSNDDLFSSSTDTVDISSISSNIEGKNIESQIDLSTTSSLPTSDSIVSNSADAMNNNQEIKIEKEKILEIVKNYKLKSNLTLQQTIKEIIKLRKLGNRDIKWSITENDGFYRVDIVVDAKPKNLIFKFDFDYKKMYLKPLNTLSINTLKMMMEGTQNKGKREIKKTAPKTQNTNRNLKSNANLENINNQTKNIDSSNSDSNSYDNDNKEDSYLIIGE